MGICVRHARIHRKFPRHERYLSIQELARRWLQEALGVFNSVGAKLSIALVWSELSVCYLELGNDELALDLLLKAKDMQGAAGTVANYQVSRANIGNVYLYRGDHLTAVAYYQQALALARQINDPVSIR